MAYKVVIGKCALRDLENILDWYKGESLQALEKFVAGFYKRLDGLRERPETSTLVRQRPKFRKIKIRCFPYYIVVQNR
ncbi:MAG: hypothetical protein EPGJADBJ_05339 [Saprospiraceae bacterium]|nr:hypothetical protein [Saprospiraceae bacterium]